MKKIFLILLILNFCIVQNVFAEIKDEISMKANNVYKISDFDNAYRVNRKFDDFYIVQKNGRFGVYNKLNNTLSTDIVYDKIESVDIAGNIFKAWKNNKCILINVECIHYGNKEFVTKKSKNKYDSIETILNENGFRVKAKNNGKYGILDTDGCKMESGFMYDDIEYDKYKNLYFTYIDGKKEFGEL